MCVYDGLNEISSIVSWAFECLVLGGAVCIGLNSVAWLEEVCLWKWALRA